MIFSHDDVIRMLAVLPRGNVLHDCQGGGNEFDEDSAGDYIESKVVDALVDMLERHKNGTNT